MTNPNRMKSDVARLHRSPQRESVCRIRILTRHAALQYVLARTAPCGVVLQTAELMSAYGKTQTWLIEVELTKLAFSNAPMAWAECLPDYVDDCGANWIEVNGQVLERGVGQLRERMEAFVRTPAVRSSRKKVHRSFGRRGFGIVRGALFPTPVANSARLSLFA